MRILLNGCTLARELANRANSYAHFRPPTKIKEWPYCDYAVDDRQGVAFRLAYLRKTPMTIGKLTALFERRRENDGSNGNSNIEFEYAISI